MKTKRGFTLIELLLVMGIATVIFTVSGISWSRLQKVSQLDQIAGDIKVAIYQAQALTKSNQASGVYFETNRYIVFKGNEYQVDQPENLITNLPEQITLTQINLLDHQITFDHRTGYFIDYRDGDKLTITDEQSGQFKNLIFNPTGLVDITNN